MKKPQRSQSWGLRRMRLYGQQRRAEHRALTVGHRQQPEYSRKMRRMLNRLFR